MKHPEPPQLAHFNAKGHLLYSKLPLESELLTLSLGMSPATLGRTLIFATHHTKLMAKGEG